MINTEFFKLNDTLRSGSYNALAKIIKSAEIYLHKIDNEYELKKQKNSKLSIFFIVEGEAGFNGKYLPEFTTVIPSTNEEYVFFSKRASILEIELNLCKEQIKETSEKLPLIIKYSETRAYKEDCKSEKTTSRMILDDGVIPCFAMGSVETCGPDCVAEHEHANVDQFFFSLPGTETYLTVSGEKLLFPEKTAMHVPLGSSHGVAVNEGAKLHYLWCDFYLDETTSDYIKTAHKFI